MGYRLMRRVVVTVFTAVGLSLLPVGCTGSSSRSSTRYPPPGQPPPQQYPPGQPPPVAGQPPGAPSQSHPPVLDPINNVDIVWLRNRAQEVIAELIAALAPGPAQRVQGIPLVVDDTVGEVNAFAACTKSGKALMAISDGLLDIEAHLAQAKATDELFGSNKTDEYIRMLAQQQQPDQPVVRPPLGFFVSAQHLDPRKVQRQHQLYDEQVAFVLGHEMAHHYLGHLPCSAGAVSVAEVGLVLSSVVPAFNQPNEFAADASGINNVLSAGSRRAGYRWTEGGAMLTMQFFAGMDQFSPVDIVFAFERSHPPPLIRRPVVQQAAAAWRVTGGGLLPIP